MKKLSLYILFLILSLFSSFIVMAERPVISGLKKIIDKGELVASFTLCRTAMFTEIDSDNNISGIDMEIAEQIAKDLGVKLRVLKSAPDWNGVVDEVSAGKADIGISYLSMTAERSKNVLYTSPYALVRQALLFNNFSVAQQRKAGNKTIREMFVSKDGMTIGVWTGSSYIDFAKSLFPNVKIKEFDTTDQLVNATLNRTVDAIMTDELEIDTALKKDPGIKVKVSQVILKDQPDYISIAVDPSNKDLQEFVNNIIKLRQFNYTIESAAIYTEEKAKLQKQNK